MLGLSFLCRRSPLRLTNRRPFLGELFWGCPFLDAPVVRSFSSTIKIDEQPFVVSYLVNSVGFSQEAATLVSQKGGLKFENPDSPNAVLALLRDHGFSEDQIFKVVRSQPDLLKYDPKATLLPKIEFFYSVGISRTQVVHLLASKPRLLTLSLKSTIVPWYTFLKKLLCLNDKVIAALKHPSIGICGDVEQNFAPNIAFLREIGVPEARISFLSFQQPRALAKKHEDFKKSVDKVIEMGFHPSRSTFICALRAFSQCKMSTLEQKKDVYRGYGWSENDIQKAFRVHPQTLCLSVKKIINVMNFLVKKTGWQLADITRSPQVLFYSLEKRIIPRCSVIQVLQLKGLIKKDVSLPSILTIDEKQFLDKFLTKFQHDVPELLGVYQGKLACLM